MVQTKAEFEIVNRRVTGTVRENGLFNFVEDSRDLNCLRPYETTLIHRGGNEEKTAHLIRLAVNDDTPCHFPGFTLTRHHLSIDRLYTREESTHSRGFTCAHYSAYLENTETGEARIVHVYFNRHGTEVTFDGETRDDKATAQSQPAIKLLNEIIQHKNTRYLELYERTFALNESLIKARDDETWIERATTLLSVFGQLNRYNDETEDRREALLRAQMRLRRESSESPEAAVIAEAKEAASTEASQEAATSTPAPLNTKKANAARKAKKQKARKLELARTKTVFHEKLNALIHAFGDTSTRTLDETVDEFLALDAHLQQSFFDVHSYALDLKTNDKAALQNLPFSHSALVDYFKTAVLEGRLDSVQALFPLMSCYTNMLPIFHELVNAITTDNPGANAALEAQITVANYFSEQDALYRAMMSIQAHAFLFTEDLTVGKGILLRLFLSNNFLAFEMLLDQGLSPENNQFIIYRKGFGALQAVLAMYSGNPNVRFVNALLSHQASLKLSVNLLHTDVGLSNRFIHRDFRASPTLLNRFNAAGGSVDSIGFEKSTDVLNFAHYFLLEEHPDLMRVLTEHATYEQLVHSAAVLLNSTAFRSTFSAKEHEKFPELCSTRAEVLSLMTQTGSHTRFVYYRDPNQTCPNIAEISQSAHHILDRIHALDATTSLSEKEQLMTRFVHKGNALAAEGNISFALDAYKAAQFTYSLIDDPTRGHHEFMIHVLCKSAPLVESKIPGTRDIYHSMALDILETLPDNMRKALLNTPIGKYLIKKVNKTASHVLVRYPRVHLMTGGASPHVSLSMLTADDGAARTSATAEEAGTTAGASFK